MPVKNVDMHLIEARRISKPGEPVRNVRIDNNSTVTLVREVDEGTAVVEFRYTANYSGLGNIRIEGSLIFEGDATELTKQWSTTSNMPDDIASEIHTAVMQVCVPEAIMISRDIKMPPPLPLPKVNVSKKQSKESKPSSGFEVA